ncbi:hypothetical protein MKX03_021445 [Papaver bracteatum]|nr:hypothetical protein MKX03_021445 [Papaver bracteatum]
MLNAGSGFEWDYANNKLVCERKLFDIWAKSHPSIKGVYGKVFPHLDALVEIFAEDRANASLVEELEEIDKEDEQEREKQTEQETEQEQSNQSGSVDEANNGNDKGRWRKRVRSSSLDVGSGESSGDSNGLNLMANSFSKFVSGTLSHFEAIRSTLAQESDTNKQLFEELQKIDGLTDDDVIDAASIIL